MVQLRDSESTGGVQTVPTSQTRLPLSHLPVGSAPAIYAELLVSWLVAFCFDQDNTLPEFGYGAMHQTDGTGFRNSLPANVVDLARDKTLATALTEVRRAVQNVVATEDMRTGKYDAFVLYENASKEDKAKASEWTFHITATVDASSLILTSHSRDLGLTAAAAARRLSLFTTVLTATLTTPSTPLIAPIRALPADLSLLWHWNADLPVTISRCMHDIISEQARLRPSAPAIESWDGNWTYSQLDDLSTRLAFKLVAAGAKPGDVIPLCFEKCKWTVIGVLAIMKAGATFSLTDPAQPEGRLRTIVEQTGAKHLLVSRSQAETGAKIANGAQVIVVDAAVQLAPKPTETLPAVDPESAMYVIFTSGSTGKPKGVVVSHVNFTSGAIPRADLVGYREHSRVFDFASYAFDVSIDCMICTLSAGGCLCIPTDQDRMDDLSGAIRKTKVNMAHMTPSVARVLDADIIPSLDVLGLGGEAVSSLDAANWSQTTSVVIAYGPSECTVGCTINNAVNATCTNEETG